MTNSIRVGLAACLTATFAVAGLAARPAAPMPPVSMELWNGTWQVRGMLALTNEPMVQRPVHEAIPEKNQPVTLESAGLWTNDYAVEFLVRFHQVGGLKGGRGGQAALTCGAGVTDGVTNLAYTVAIGPPSARGLPRSVRFGAESVAGARGENVPGGGRWDLRTARPRFTAEDISPVMEEDFRLRLEHDFGAYTPSGGWHRVRFEARPAMVRVYVDGLLVGYEPNRLAAPGAIRLQLNGPVLVAGLEVHPLPPEDAVWYPAMLDGLCNAAGFVDRASLVPAEASGLLTVDGVPFRLPDGALGLDHVDVGVSRFRYNLGRGYEPAAKPNFTYPGADKRDPAQLIFRIPHASYRRAWVLAASDGEPNSTPVLTVRFFKPAAGWDVDAARPIPEWTATTAAADARRLAVRMVNGKTGSLWAVPIELDAGALAGDYRDVGLMTVELTKETHDFAAYPDPCNYNRFQGGLPSAARVYGLTFEKAPVAAYGIGERRGNLYPHPEKALWRVELASQSGKPATVQVQVRSEGPLGTVSTQIQSVALQPGERKRVEVAPATKEWGLYKVLTTVTCGDWSQAREGTFLMLPPDKERKADATTSRWGIWNWFGGHGTEKDPVENFRQMRALGILKGASLNVSNAVPSGKPASPAETRAFWGIGAGHDRIVSRGLPDWAVKNPDDPAAQAAFAKEVAAKAAEVRANHPDIQYFNAFAEDAISLRMTHGLPPYAFGQPWFDYTDKERERVRGYLVVARATAAGVREGAPGAKFIMGHCSPNFYLPFFREPDWDPTPFDGFGLDMPQFERMPERPARATEPNSLYFLYKEMKDRGIKKELVHLESYFPSSLPQALGHRRQADSVVRTAVLSMSLGSTSFLDCWSLHDCSDSWGSQHYGCVGLIGRAPEFNPKPAAAAYATMSRVLDLADYDGYLDTGSRSAYALRFKDPDGKRLVYACWTIRGSRPLSLTLEPGAKAVAVDENGNETALTPENGVCRVMLSPTPVWVVVRGGGVAQAEAGEPAYAEAPGGHTVLLENFEKADWSYSPEPYPSYASNHWDVVREPVPMTSARVHSPERGSTVWRVAMAEQPEGKPFVGFYGVFAPRRPIPIPGKARALGLLGRGQSAWNRVVFEIEDAKGEIFQSIGTKNAWNCDDTHSWSYFNFDGWRYMEFPLPGNLPGDNYREKDSVWWNCSAEGIVDLPVKLTRLMVETRTHQIYVNDLLPILDSAVEMDDLVAVYDSPDLATDAPVKLQRAAAPLAAPPRGTGQGLPNPIAELAATGVEPAPVIARLYPPETQHDGTKVNVAVAPVEGAKQYKAWVSVYPDGRGARALATGEKPDLFIKGLKPSVKFYFYATIIGADGKESKPSKVRETVLQDEFPMK
jgi:hypothetical protein